MAWTNPRTWVAGELITADIMNEHVRDNLEALKEPPTAVYDVNEGADYTTTSITFVDVDADDLALTIETGGGDVMVHFHGTVRTNVTGEFVYFDVDVDGSRHGGDNGIIAWAPANNASDKGAISFTRLIRGLNSGSHTFKLQWRTSGSTTITLWAGAGTSGLDLHPQFWAREVS